MRTAISHHVRTGDSFVAVNSLDRESAPFVSICCDEMSIYFDVSDLPTLRTLASAANEALANVLKFKGEHP